MTKERFTPTEPLETPHTKAWVECETVVEISSYDGGLSLTVPEARDLLEWLQRAVPAVEPGAGLSDKDLLHAAIDGIKALSQGTAHTEYDSGYEQALREAIGILSQRLPERTTV